MMLLIAALVAVTVPVAASRPQLQPPVVDPSWSSAATFSLDWDIAHRRKAMQPTTVRVLGDGRYLYIRFDAAQQAPVAVTQRSDDTVVGGSIASNQNISWSNDDDVWVDLWPTGPGGFEYQFEANAVGAHNESSTENASFAPHWESHGGTTDHGFSITMAIPLSVIHGAHSGTWRAQFIRFERATGAVDVWSYDAAQTLPDDAQRAGDLDVTVAEIRQAKPASRVALYGLGALASASAGGSTSRVGADLSIPVAPTAAFFSTLHPDYSNVELDQQTIAPTVTQRVFSEVRPFFTQGASYYNPFWTAIGIGQLMTLYTPNIPTPSQGYAFEGKQGQFGLAGFDAVSAGR
ncbi:MAG TPA: hypothetical protein VEJ20_08980, partial [Candidatus Eremiobacteraceae bacterium]|nr:hypothetical protein [Candidatus Eremiobacteraceae bacterium]